MKVFFLVFVLGFLVSGYAFAQNEDPDFFVVEKTCALYSSYTKYDNPGVLYSNIGDSYPFIEYSPNEYWSKVSLSKSNRWIRSSCGVLSKTTINLTSNSDSNVFLLENKEEKKNSIASTALKKEPKSADFLLALTWLNAFCKNKQHSKQCSNDSIDNRFVLHGLWPKTGNFCNSSKSQILLDKKGKWDRLNPIDLEPSVRKKLFEVMPGHLDNLHRHEWVKHGTCYDSDPNVYFQDSTNLTNAINNTMAPILKKYLGKTLDIFYVRQAFDQKYGFGAYKRVFMTCQKGNVSEIRVVMNGDPNAESVAQLIQNAKPVKNRQCERGFLLDH